MYEQLEDLITDGTTRGRVHQTRQGWRADLVTGGWIWKTGYCAKWEDAIAWVNVWLSTVNGPADTSPSHATAPVARWDTHPEPPLSVS